MTREHLFVNKVWIASDHAGLELKKFLIEKLSDWKWEDLGPFTETSVDYPDYADILCKAVEPTFKNESQTRHFGVLICGSGQGMAIRANRYPFIRAALCWDEEVAKLSRQHNDANVLCLGGRLINHHVALSILKKFAETKFEEGRHTGRVQKLGRPSSC